MAKMKEPDFYEQAGAFVVRLWSRHYQAPLTDEHVLSARQENILKLLEAKPLAPQEMLDLLKEGISDRTLRRDLQDLKEKGYLDSEGQGPSSRWFLSPKSTRT
jgi:predicted HTH transcriptional regulator